MAQPRRTPEQWRRLVEGWPGSGQTQQAYCDRQGITLASLRRWRQLLRQRRETGATGRIAAGEPVRLVPVELIGSGRGEAKALALVLPDGMRIEIPSDFDTPTLQRLLGVLREAA
jgi:hypothetical protein